MNASSLGKRSRLVTPQTTLLDLSSPTPEPSSPPPSTNGSLRPHESLSSVATTSNSTLVDVPWRGTTRDGLYVWLLVDPETWQAPASVNENHDPLLWWPAKMVRWSKTEATARLYGVGPPARTVQLNGSLQGKVCTLITSGRLRFEEPCVHNSVGAGPSPSKKIKPDRSDLTKQWEEATTSALQEKIVHEDDGLPPPSILSCRLWRDPPADAFDEAMNGDLTSLEDEEEASDETPFVWIDDGEDDGLEIPGELVLCRGTNKLFWPARIISQRIPSKPKQKRKFQVEWCDRSPRNWVSRSAFFTLAEEGFATCKIGELETLPGYSPDDSDSEDTLGPSLPFQGRQRSPSPDIVSLGRDTHFGDLSIRQQFAFVKPVLSALLKGVYPPAEEERSLFLRGGKFRLTVMERASRRGFIGKKEVEQLQDVLAEWVLRDDRFGKRIELDSDEIQLTHISETAPPGDSATSIQVCPHEGGTTASSPQTLDSVHNKNGGIGEENSVSPVRNQRQTGDDAFEALSPVEKIEFCANVLLPEAILQFHLWREGMRTSPDLLGEVDEVKLHRDGNDLIERRDWVLQIKNMRKTAEEQLNYKQRSRLQNAEETQMKRVVGGTATRPVYG